MRLDGGGDAATMAAQQVDYGSRSKRCRHFCPLHMEQYSPCREDGISPAQEASLRKSYCIFMQTLGRKLRLPQVTIASAIVFCHRFFLRQSLARNDRYIIATVCMFLAGKVEETPERLHNVIIVSYEVRYAEDPDAALRIKQKEVYDEQTALLLMGERLVLVTLGFNLNVVHPYKPLIAAIKHLTLPPTHSLSELAQIAWNFVNDGLQTLLCLQFKACHIAAGAIYLAAKFLRIKLFCDWEDLLLREFDISLQQLEDVSNQILQSYDSLVEPSANIPGLCKPVRVAINHTKQSVQEARSCSCILQEAPSATPFVKYEENNYMHSIQRKFPEVNVEEREEILLRDMHNIRVDFDNARPHTVHSDLTEEKEIPELARGRQHETEDYWEFEGNRSDEGNQCDFSPSENVGTRSTGNLWLGRRERNVRRAGRHISPQRHNGKERNGTSVGPDRHHSWVRISSRERGVHKATSRREPLVGLTTKKQEVNTFVTRRKFLLWLSNKKKLHSERVHNRLKLFRRKAEILGHHPGQRSRGVKESGMRRSRYDFMS